MNGLTSGWIARAMVAFAFAMLGVRAEAQTPTPQPVPDMQLLTNGTVFAIARLPDGSVILGGSFRSVNGISRANLARVQPDGELDPTWHPSVDGPVWALGVDAKGMVYVGGGFFSVDGRSRQNLAKISADAAGVVDEDWNPVLNGAVETLAVDAAGHLFVGGYFSSVNGQSRSHVAKLATNGSGIVDAAWAPSVGGTVRTLVLDGEESVYIGGDFVEVDGQQRTYVAKLDATGTGALDPDWAPALDGAVHSLAVDTAHAVYAGGDFQNVFGVQRRNIAKFADDGTVDGAWNATANGIVHALAIDEDGSVYAGGLFDQIGFPRVNLAKLSGTDGAAVQGWDPAPSNTVMALAVASGVVHVGGGFSSIGGDARLAFATLSAAGDATASVIDAESPGGVYAMAVQSNGGVIVGGNFLKANQQRRGNLLRLQADGALDPDWSPAADAWVTVLAVGNDDAVYASGGFSTINGEQRFLAKLAGGGTGALDASWDPGSTVSALAVDASGAVYAGGGFTHIGGLARNRIAKLSGAGTGAADVAWNPAPNGYVWALAIGADGSVYAGGDFTSIGGQPRNRIARLTSSGSGAADAAWMPGANGSVRTIAASAEGHVYAGGMFTAFGTLMRNRIAKLSATGTGMVDQVWNPGSSSPVASLSVTADGFVYVSGNFGTIGGQSRNYVARLYGNGSGQADPDWNPAPDGPVWALAMPSAGTMLVGGAFTRIGGVTRDGLAAFEHVIHDTSVEVQIDTIIPEPSVVGETASVTFSVIAAEGTPSGTVTISASTGENCTAPASTDSCELVFMVDGPRMLIADYSGDATHDPAQSTSVQHEVNDASTALVITSHSPDPSLPWQAVEVAVALTVVSPGSGTPHGGILVTDGVDACTIPEGASACQLVLQTRGPRTLTAAYSGDGNYGSSSDQAIHRVNREPIGGATQHVTIEDAVLGVAAASGVISGASDPDGDTLTIVNAGTLSASGIGGDVVLNVDGSFSYTPPADTSGVATFVYIVSDGLEEAAGIATITVDAVNDAPTIALAAVSAWPAGESGTKTQPGFANVTSFGPSDEAGQQVLSWLVRTISDPAGVASNVAIAANGTLSYTLSGNAGSATFGVKLQDDGGVANGGSDTSIEHPFTITVAAGLDLSIAIDDDRDFAQGGGTVEYTIVVHNAGPNVAVGAQVKDLLPFNLVDASWTCTPDAGASCTPAGDGDIDDTVTLPMGATLTYLLGATVVADPEVPVENSVSVSAPVGVPDANGTNNSATDTDTVGIFADGFGEIGATLH